jgi:glycine oxidase
MTGVPSQHIAVIGAGLLGRLTAWRLARLGLAVDLFEAGSLRDTPKAAAFTAAAMISPLSEVVDSERLIYDMGLASLDLWPLFLQQLSEGLSQPLQPINYREDGSLVVAHQQDSALLQQFAERLQFHLGNATEHSQWLQQNQLRELEPDLAGFHRGLLLPREAHIDNHALLAQLLTALQQLNVNCFERTPINNVNAHYIDTGTQKREYDWVIDCRGFGAKSDIKDLRGVRGEVLWVETGEIELQRPVRFMHPKYKLYVVPKPNRQFIIGATEIESEDLSPISLRSTLELSSALYALNPAFAEARVLRSDVNLRPSLIDNRPRIVTKPGLLQANGLHRHGYLLAPVVVENLVALITQQHPFSFADTLIEAQA